MSSIPPPRTRANLLAAVAAVDLLHTRDIQPGYWPEPPYTRSGTTWCNVAARRMLEQLGLIIPPVIANELADWFPSDAGKAAGWVSADLVEAQFCAEKGCPVVAVYKNPTGHGHIAIGVPSSGTPGFHIAQAGSRNFTNEPIEHGFGRLSGPGALPVFFFVHP